MTSILGSVKRWVTAMKVMWKQMADAKVQSRTVVARNGKVLEARYATVKQANDAATVIAKRREALLYLSKR